MTTPNHSRGELIPINPPQRPDPYPKHVSRDQGVRQHTPPEPQHARKVTYRHANSSPLPFAAALPTPTAHPDRPCRIPWAATGLYALGQIGLAVTIAFGGLGPVVGILICLLWLACGLLLIAAQIITDAQEQPAELANSTHEPMTDGSEYGNLADPFLDIAEDELW